MKKRKGFLSPQIPIYQTQKWITIFKLANTNVVSILCQYENVFIVYVHQMDTIELFSIHLEFQFSHAFCFVCVYVSRMLVRFGTEICFRY